jgi:plastocyanin
MSWLEFTGGSMQFRVLSGAAFAFAAAATIWGCGGSSSSSTPTNPTPTPTPSANTVTVTIVGSSGNQAYQPNPVQVNMGDTVAFKNADHTLHHVVMDDGSADLGNISPGSTASMTLKTSGGNYHCTIHTSMVGSINGKDAPVPCQGQYCP